MHSEQEVFRAAGSHIQSQGATLHKGRFLLMSKNREQYIQSDTVKQSRDSVLLKRLLKIIQPYRYWVLLCFVILLLVSAIPPLLRPTLLRWAIDDHIPGKDYEGLILIATVFVATYLIHALLTYGFSYLMQYVGQHLIYDLRTMVYRHVNRLHLQFFDQNPVGRIVTRVTNDVEALNTLFSSGLVLILSDVFILIWIVILMMLLNWKLALLCLSFLLFLILPVIVFRLKVRRAYRNVRKHLARLNAFMQEKITGMQVVQLFQKESEELERYASINADYRYANIRVILYYSLFFAGVQLLSTIGLASIIWYGSSQFLSAQLSMGTLAAFIFYVGMFFGPIVNLSDKFNLIQDALASSERIFTVLDTKPEIENPEIAVPLPDCRGKIEFDKVHFAYKKDEYVLKDITFTIQSGETVAFVGATGAGKSSIINLICRFYDIQSGSIRLDGIDIRRLNKDTLRQHIAIVLQDSVLFAGSIYYNIGLDNPEISKQDIINAARLVGAHRFISAFPNAYEHELGEGGGSLSSGQKQLITFARALASKSQILILDEATASVDVETEHLIQEAIETLLAKRTAIVIAHRMSTIQKADKIIVLHKGQIKEIGNHQTLLAKQGIYYRLYQLHYQNLS